MLKAFQKIFLFTSSANFNIKIIKSCISTLTENIAPRVKVKLAVICEDQPKYEFKNKSENEFR